MRWQQWVLVGLYGFSTLVNIALVGRPRQPLTGGGAAGSLVVTALMTWMVVSL